MTTTYRGYVITTPSGLDEQDRTYTVYRIYKPKPLTSLSSDEYFDDASTALQAAKTFIDKHLEASKG